MSGEKRSVTVRIAGEEHTIRSATEPAYTRRCAKHVDERIHEIRRQAGLIEGHKAAILAAMSLADECFQAQAELERLRSEVVERTERLTRALLEAIPEGQERG